MYDMKTVDFPAGHSMDTEWFAVDKDGNIAIFNSNNEGAVPIDVEPDLFFVDLLEKYSEQITKSLRKFYLSEVVLDILLHKCDFDSLKRLEEDNFSRYFILLLNKGKKWEDLNFEDGLANGSSSAISLSPNDPLFLFHINVI